jgi:hypothetical protein
VGIGCPSDVVFMDAEDAAHDPEVLTILCVLVLLLMTLSQTLAAMIVAPRLATALRALPADIDAATGRDAIAFFSIDFNGVGDFTANTAWYGYPMETLACATKQTNTGYSSCCSGTSGFTSRNTY